MRAGLLVRRAGLAASGLELLVKLCFASEVTASCSSPRARASAVAESARIKLQGASPRSEQLAARKDTSMPS